MVNSVTTKSFCYLTNEKFKLVKLDHIPPTNTRTITNTGSTGNYISISTPHTNKQVAINPIEVTMKTSDTVPSNHTYKLDLPSLPKSASQGYMSPRFPAGALLSIGLL